MLVHEPMLLLTPKYYYTGKDNMIYNTKTFFQFTCTGIIHSVVIWLINVFCLKENGIMNATGVTNDYWVESLQIFTSVIIVTQKINL